MRMFLSTLIDAPQGVVFAAVSDFPNAAGMIGGIDSIEMLSQANDGTPIGVGTRFKESRTMMGKEAVEEMEVTEYDPPRAYTLSAVSCGVRFGSRVTCLEETPGSGAGSGCRLSYDIKTEAQSMFAKVVSPVMGVMMKGMMRRAMEKDLADMKRHIEGANAVPAGADDGG